MHRHLSAGLALALVGLVTSSLSSPASAKPQVWSQDWEIENNPIVHVRVDDARVRVHAGPARRISTRVEYELKRWGMVFGVRSPSVVFERKGDEMWIHARDPRGLAVVGGVEERFSVDVTVPSDVTLFIHSDDGHVDCEPLRGKFQIETRDGAVQAAGLRGNVTVVTGDGRVILDDAEGDIRIRTKDGRVQASGRFDVVDVVTRDGSVQVTARRGSKVLNPWLIESGDGRIELRIPHNLDALLDVRSRDGRLHIELPIPSATDPKQNVLVGELNRGGPALRVRSKDGGITLALSD